MRHHLLAFAALLSFGATAQASEWPFTAYLDGKEIGQHRFALKTTDEGLKLVSEADFKVKLLFINAYSYQHRASEFWQGDCLQRLEARTEENRDISLVNGERKMLQQDRLLNPQTGEWLDVVIRRMGRETIEVRGQQQPALRYRLTAPKMQIDLWYSEDYRWLALESKTPEGYLISYKLR